MSSPETQPSINTNELRIQQTGNVKITRQHDGAFIVQAYSLKNEFRFKIDSTIEERDIEWMMLMISFGDINDEAVAAIARILAEFPHSLDMALERCLLEADNPYSQERLIKLFKEALTLPGISLSFDFQARVIKRGWLEAFTLLAQSEYFDPNINSILHEAIAQHRAGNIRFLYTILTHTKFDIHVCQLDNKDLSFLSAQYATKPLEIQQIADVEITKKRNDIFQVRYSSGTVPITFKVGPVINEQDIYWMIFTLRLADDQAVHAVTKILSQFPQSLYTVLEECLQDAVTSHFQHKFAKFFKALLKLPDFKLRPEFQSAIIKYGWSEAFTLLIQSEHFDPNESSILHEAAVQHRNGNTNFLDEILVHTKCDPIKQKLNGGDSNLIDQRLKYIAATESVGSLKITKQPDNTFIVQVEQPDKKIKTITIGHASSAELAAMIKDGFISNEDMSAIVRTCTKFPILLHRTLWILSRTASQESLIMLLKAAVESPVFDPNINRSDCNFRSEIVKKGYLDAFKYIASHKNFNPNIKDGLREAIKRHIDGDTEFLNIILSHPRINTPISVLRYFTPRLMKAAQNIVNKLWRALEHSVLPKAITQIMVDKFWYTGHNTNVSELQALYFQHETDCNYTLPTEVFNQYLLFKPTGYAPLALPTPCSTIYQYPEDVLLAFTYCPSIRSCELVKQHLLTYSEEPGLGLILASAAVNLLQYNKMGDDKDEAIISVQSGQGILTDNSYGHYDLRTQIIRLHEKSFMYSRTDLLHEIMHKAMDVIFNNYARPKHNDNFSSTVIGKYLEHLAQGFDLPISKNTDLNSESIYSVGRKLYEAINTHKDKESKISNLGDGAPDIIESMKYIFFNPEYQHRMEGEFIARAIEFVAKGFRDTPILASFKEWFDTEFIPAAKEYISHSPHCTDIVSIPGIVCVQDVVL